MIDDKDALRCLGDGSASTGYGNGRVVGVTDKADMIAASCLYDSWYW